MNAAERLFLEKGIAATRIDEIVATAGVAKGTFYLYFKTKESLLAAIQDRFVTTFCALGQEAMDRYRADQWSLRLRVWIKTAVHTYLDQIALHDVIFHEFHPEDRQAMHDNAVIDQLVALLTGGIAAKVWVAEDPRMTAIMVFNAFHGAVDSAVAKGGRIDRPSIIRTLTAFLERAIART